MVVGGVIQPVPLCNAAMSCPRVAKRLGVVLNSLVRDPRCAAHSCVAPARAARRYPPSWLRAAGPSEPLLALAHQQLCQLWGDMVISARSLRWDFNSSIKAGYRYMIYLFVSDGMFAKLLLQEEKFSSKYEQAAARFCSGSFNRARKSHHFSIITCVSINLLNNVRYFT